MKIAASVLSISVGCLAFAALVNGISNALDQSEIKRAAKAAEEQAKIEAIGGPLDRDTCLYRQLLELCLKSLPAGPQQLTAAGNDWAELVEECRSVAKEGSNRRRNHIPPECK